MTVTVDRGERVGLDAADRLMLDECSEYVSGANVVVVGSAMLAEAVRSLGAASVRVSDDGDPSTEDLAPALFSAASAVLVRLPKSLAALDRVARAIATSAPTDVVVIAGGRLKYMTVGMNEILLRSFARLDVSLARQKSRVLLAREPRPATQNLATRIYDVALDLWVGSVGGVFAAATVDIGTRAMLSVFDQLPEYDTAIDFGCGTGVLAAELKRRRPAARVIASDVSAAAVESARETALANGLAFDVVRDDLLSAQSDASADLVVLNPPFHEGGGVSTDTAHAMFAEARRVLKPGGVLCAVWNSHLGYTGALVRTVGPTTELTRTPKFTVTASRKTTN